MERYVKTFQDIRGGSDLLLPSWSKVEQHVRELPVPDELKTGQADFAAIITCCRTLLEPDEGLIVRWEDPRGEKDGIYAFDGRLGCLKIVASEYFYGWKILGLYAGHTSQEDLVDAFRVYLVASKAWKA
jgi:hypothetical protein